MKYEFFNISNIKAAHLVDAVTLLISLDPEADVRIFNPKGEYGVYAAVVPPLRARHESTLSAFYRLDRFMDKVIGEERGFKVVFISPIQDYMTDPFDTIEMEAFVGIARMWADQCGCKIVLVMDLFLENKN